MIFFLERVAGPPERAWRPRQVVGLRCSAPCPGWPGPPPPQLAGASSEGGNQAAVPEALGGLSTASPILAFRPHAASGSAGGSVVRASRARARDDGLARLHLVTRTRGAPARRQRESGGGDGAVSGLEPGPGIYRDPCEGHLASYVMLLAPGTRGLKLEHLRPVL